MKGLNNKIALVTGATGLLGTAIAHRLSQEGATVAVASRQVKKAKKWISDCKGQSTGKFVPVEFDLADEGSIKSAFRYLTEHIGIPTILIANASLRAGLDTPFEQVSHGSFSHLFEVDAAGHFLCARYLVEQLAPEMSASIVFVSSIYALAAADPAIYPEGMAPAPVQYASVKSGILGLSRYLAGIWGHQGVRVNAVVAGGVLARDRQSDEFVRRYARKTMLGRMAQPEEIANAAAFLASDESSYITGEHLIVDGGFCAW